MSDILRANSWAVKQVGWIGHTGRLYSLDEKPSKTEPEGYAPLWQQIGVCRYDEDKGSWWIDE
jgi:hypothetical protein